VTDGDNLPVSLTVTETGVVVHGNPVEVTRYVERVRRHVATVERAEVVHLADSAAAVTALGSVLAASADYVQLSPRSLKLLADNGAIPGQTPGYFYGFVRDSQHFAGNLEFQSVSLAANQAAALQLAAATVALKVAIANVEQAVARVEGKVESLIAHHEAERIAKIVVQRSVLTDTTDALDRTGSLPSVDWDVVAHLGIAVPAAIEELREFVRIRIASLDGAADTAERAQKLRDVVERGELEQALSLLVVAEDAYYKWQRVRLERARTTDPGHVGDLAQRANEALANDIASDHDLVTTLATKLNDYGQQRPLERLHPFATRHLQRDADQLNAALQDFAQARRVQVAEWTPFGKPSWAETRQEVRDRTTAIGRQVKEISTATGHAVGEQVTELTSRAQRAAAAAAADAASAARRSRQATTKSAERLADGTKDAWNRVKKRLD
jgi:hypothetical protein